MIQIIETTSKQKQRKTNSKKILKKIALLGLSISSLLYISNGFNIQKTINSKASSIINKSIDYVTTDIDEASEKLISTIETTEDKTKYYDSMTETISALYTSLPENEQIRSLEQIITNNPEASQKFIQQAYSLQTDEFKRQFILTNLDALSPEEKTKLNSEITGEYINQKKEDLKEILQNARKSLEPVYEGIRDIFMFYN